MRIDLLQLQCSDLSSLDEFYSRLPGVLLKEKSSTEIRMQIGFSSLIFTRIGQKASPYYHFAFNVHPLHFEQLVKELEENARINLLPFEGDVIMDFHSWKARSVYFPDPAGNILEYIARDKLANNDAASRVISIGEIGLGGTEVIPLVQSIQDSTGIPVFDKGHNDFRALGDDEGLFVISSNRRNWFPTDKAVLPFPVSAKITVNGHRYTINSEGKSGKTEIIKIT